MRVYTRRMVPAPDQVQREFALTHEERSRSRLALMDEDGIALAITLPRGTVLADGDVLATEAGETVRIHAATQALARVTAATPLGLLRAVYHLANRHVPAQLLADAALIERDPVLEHLLVHLGARVEHLDAPFTPEGGAYDAHGHAHASSHGHEHGEPDPVSATVGEQLSIEAHQRRSAAR
jgi:urease accessory protein